MKNAQNIPFEGGLQRIVFMIFLIMALGNMGHAQEDIDVGPTGWSVKKPVLASACANGCPWGELGDYVKNAMKPFGYSVVLCRNCNRSYGPRLVSESSYPPPLDEANIQDGVNIRINAPVDFGITSSAMLSAAFSDKLAGAGPYKNLRLIARIEDPFYFLVAFKKESKIESFSQVKEQHIPIRIFSTDSNMADVLAYYGISTQDIVSWGGKLMVSNKEALDGDFDVICGFLASPAMNPESSQWTILSQKYELNFIELPDDLLKIIATENVDAEIIESHQCMLKGMNREMKTVGRSGEAVFIRDDAPSEVAYDLAKAIDENHGALKWYIRVYTYDPNTVWQNFGVPLHAGAEKYYREVGYMKPTLMKN